MIDGRLHLAGMVSSGHSTLMLVIVVWAAPHGNRLTLVVSTVTEALDRSKHLRLFGVAAVPVVGMNRAEHLAPRSAFLALEQTDSTFRFLSTACPLDAVRSKVRSRSQHKAAR